MSDDIPVARRADVEDALDRMTAQILAAGGVPLARGLHKRIRRLGGRGVAMPYEDDLRVVLRFERT